MSSGGHGSECGRGRWSENGCDRWSERGRDRWSERGRGPQTSCNVVKPFCHRGRDKLECLLLASFLMRPGAYPRVWVSVRSLTVWASSHVGPYNANNSGNIKLGWRISKFTTLMVRS